MVVEVSGRSATRSFGFAELDALRAPCGRLRASATASAALGGHERMRSHRAEDDRRNEKGLPSGRPFSFRLAHSERFERPTLRFVVSK